ncbi:hypothetical protein QEG98_02970 [Myxococcus sp. MxC21-1]|uniref:hypothetical protein n=1 Tax=Myxococcus sp. MxC21-1 TaxID=3041439 RepID=UPI0029313B8F|nr:hypothetical protein [Myxococcus sp. MxC21-1]WNZ62795.1 hypothetical protein QEG98_02970 [Myxococcus sp. MxC21-1]
MENGDASGHRLVSPGDPRSPQRRCGPASRIPARALIVWPAEVLEPQAFPDRIAAAAGSVVALSGPHTLEEVEREHTLRVMASAPTLGEAARVLGIDALTLWCKCKEYESGGKGEG